MASTMTIQEKIEDMIDYGEDRVIQFPRLYKGTLGRRILDSMYELERLAVAANRKYYKKTILQELDIENAILQCHVRRALRSKYVDRNGQQRTAINGHQYEVWSEMLAEIGRMIGGWIKSQQNTTPAAK